MTRHNIPFVLIVTYLLVAQHAKGKKDPTVIDAKDQAVIKHDIKEIKAVLLNAPSTIAVIGQLLMMTGGDNDFRLEAEQGTTFKHIKFSSSFAATLLQVANEAENSLRNADRQTQSITTVMKDVPDEISNLLKILASMQIRELKMGLPRKASILNLAFTKTAEQVGKISDGFEETFELIKEVILAITVTTRVKKTSLRRTVSLMKRTKSKHENSKKILGEIEKRGKRLEKDLARRKKAYDKAVAAIPSSWEKVAQDFVSGLTKGLASVAETMVPELEHFDFNKEDTKKYSPGPGQMEQKLHAMDEKNKNAKAYFTIANTMMTMVAAIDDDAQQLFIYMDEEFEKGEVKQRIESLQKVFEETPINSLEVQLTQLPPGHPKTMEMKGYVDRLAGITQSLSLWANKSQTISQVDQDMHNKKIDNLIKNVEPIAIAEVMSRGGPGEIDQSVGGGTPRGKELNEEFAARMQQKACEMAQDRADRNAELQDRQEMKTVKLMNQIKSLSGRKVRTEKLLEIMCKAMKLLIILRTRFDGLVVAFKGISERAKTFTQVDLKKFMGLVQVILKQIKDDPKASSAKREMKSFAVSMKDSMGSLSGYALYLHQVCQVYSTVSSQFIIPHLAGISKNVAAETNRERAKLSMDLENFQRKTKEEVERLTEKIAKDATKVREQKAKEMKELAEKIKIPGVEPVVTIQVIDAAEAKMEDVEKGFEF